MAATLVTLALVAGACGSSDSSSGGGGDGGVTPNTELDSASVTLAPEGAPKTGGTVTYGVEAETSGYNPANDRFAVSGTQIGLAIFDPLAAFDADGNPQPYLAESLTPSADYTTWTIKARPGITFHNGEALDGAAMKAHFNAAQASLLVKLTITNVSDVQVDPTDPLAVVITMKQPWATFPVYLTGQLGMVAAPEQVNAPADVSAGKPIGTGPFEFVSRTVDKEVITKRNPNYWRKDANGQQLPYLDGVNFRIIAVQNSRASSMSGSDPLTMALFNDATSLLKFTDMARSGQVQMVVDEGEREEDVIMLNTAAEPFDNPTARQALAAATNTEQYNELVNQGLFETANSPFRASSKWYEETPYPAYDPAAAAALVQQYTAETGKPLAFTLYNSGDNKTGIETLQQQYASVGMNVTVDLIPQDDFVTNAALGDFQAYEWRQFGGLDPDYEYLWWSGANAAPVGGLGLNFARNNDPVLSQALEDGRGSTDFATRKAAYDKVQAQLNADLPYIWLDHVQAAVVAQNNVRGITNGPLPGGQPSWPIGGPGGFGGATFLTQTWFQ